MAMATQRLTLAEIALSSQKMLQVAHALWPKAEEWLEICYSAAGKRISVMY
jgi:hypothetical protein